MTDPDTDHGSPGAPDPIPALKPLPTERCSMDVGCDEAGVCFAAAYGEPDRCPMEQRHLSLAKLREIEKQAIEDGRAGHEQLLALPDDTPLPKANSVHIDGSMSPATFEWDTAAQPLQAPGSTYSTGAVGLTPTPSPEPTTDQEVGEAADEHRDRWMTKMAYGDRLPTGAEGHGYSCGFEDGAAWLLRKADALPDSSEDKPMQQARESRALLKPGCDDCQRHEDGSIWQYCGLCMEIARG